MAIIIIIAFPLFSFQKEKPRHKSPTMFGIDVSSAQGNINWSTLKRSGRAEFVIMRATMGSNRQDEMFAKDFREARKYGFLIGVYHYYDPNQNSRKQAENYIRYVHLRKGNFIPIVDLEHISHVQSISRLRLGLHRFLNILEKKYGAKPILYTSFNFYRKYLDGGFSSYPLWIAAYSRSRRRDGVARGAEIVQSSCNFRVPGIRYKVDRDYLYRPELSRLLLK